MNKAMRGCKEDTTFTVANVNIGAEFFIIAGPCAVESREQIIETAKLAKAGGAKILRGGAYKPRTSPYAFQGMEEEGLKLLCEARDATGLPIATEMTSELHQPCLLAKYKIDICQIGSRNCQNYELLKRAAGLGMTVLLKRGSSATLNEFLGSAEYLLANGAERIILCERGIKTFNDSYRNTLDINAVILLRQLTHLPIIGDPSHGTGRSDMVMPASLALTAGGAQGLIIEMHYKPETAKCDGGQSVSRIDEIVRKCQAVYEAARQEKKQKLC